MAESELTDGPLDATSAEPAFPSASRGPGVATIRASESRDLALQAGMRPLRSGSIEKVVSRVTTLGEVARVTVRTEEKPSAIESGLGENHKTERAAVQSFGPRLSFLASS
jgi:hypothetical protein